MAHFYGTVNGMTKTHTSRRGSKFTGLTVTAASWQGAVTTVLYEKDGEDWARVCLEPWHGEGIDKVLYDGPVSGK